MLGAGVKPENHYLEAPLTAQIVIFLLSTLFFSLRLANKGRRILPWCWDDTTCVIAWGFCHSLMMITVAEVKLDVGRALWAQAFWQINLTLELLWVSQ